MSSIVSLSRFAPATLRMQSAHLGGANASITERGPTRSSTRPMPSHAFAPGGAPKDFTF